MGAARFFILNKEFGLAVMSSVCHINGYLEDSDDRHDSKAPYQWRPHIAQLLPR
jgi:hypothetical protein